MFRVKPNIGGLAYNCQGYTRFAIADLRRVHLCPGFCINGHVNDELVVLQRRLVAGTAITTCPQNTYVADAIARGARLS